MYTLTITVKTVCSLKSKNTLKNKQSVPAYGDFGLVYTKSPVKSLTLLYNIKCTFLSDLNLTICRSCSPPCEILLKRFTNTKTDFRETGFLNMPFRKSSL